MRGRLWPELLPDFIATTSRSAAAPQRLIPRIPCPHLRRDTVVPTQGDNPENPADIRRDARRRQDGSRPPLSSELRHFTA